MYIYISTTNQEFQLLWLGYEWELSKSRMGSTVAAQDASAHRQVQ